ncbi:MAG: LPS export ABC transporter periplasmic protein LptC [Arenimonas sp.]|uniref:LPS export ABC transporter periplasmic protein LptC n=1 Tax=Arenimonas sp. TaxID=1872635 RepID=UPI0025BB6C7A|nr:LPS export ABC transporter periplasmic protein LptC [Arenimonas sp.]MBW8367023.1 LPS export ABC transporter periplasmic protein LptC [Arenimonas sp.]
MSRTALNALLLVLAVTLVGVVYWQWLLRQVPPVEVPQRSDYILRDFELTTLGDDGAEAFTVRGPYLQRDVGGRSISLVQPRFSFPDADGAGRWQARSDAAWVSPKADHVHLIRKVEMVGPASPAGIRSRFETERLVVFPDLERATTPLPVTVTQGASIYSGTGLRVDMRAKRVQLLNEVEVRHAPRSP